MKSVIRNQRLSIDLIGAVTCAVACAAFYFAGLAPLLNQKVDATAQHRRLAGIRQKAAAAQASVHQIKQQIAELRTLAKADALQSTAAIHTNARLQDITSLAAARGLSIKGIEPGQTRQESRYQAMPLRLTGTGSYRGCVQFLHDLRESLHDTTLVDFRLSGTPDSAASIGSVVAFDLNLCWYAASTVATVGGS
jgi:Tfp pilus assembly protein PilO